MGLFLINLLCWLSAEPLFVVQTLLNKYGNKILAPRRLIPHQAESGGGLG